ncbi:hypothetical protein LOK49_LG13G00094 [Camellia lanceoleosa]|uniref:Uncharacterized protein n=1 Tax=Camellia lanceoleosa TaxID=1840588 RepID=A0ACC0FIX0_9ERIC|nr:hypothetical protein LOK49_LG13G00094 [Camellia lanceoleosa]
MGCCCCYMMLLLKPPYHVTVADDATAGLLLVTWCKVCLQLSSGLAWAVCFGMVKGCGLGATVWHGIGCEPPYNKIWAVVSDLVLLWCLLLIYDATAGTVQFSAQKKILSEEWTT